MTINRRDFLKGSAAAGAAVATGGASAIAAAAKALNREAAAFLPCDGRAVSRLDYPKLFEAVGHAYSNGGDPSQFNLPDLRGCFPWDSDAQTERDEVSPRNIRMEIVIATGHGSTRSGMPLIAGQLHLRHSS